MHPASTYIISPVTPLARSVARKSASTFRDLIALCDQRTLTIERDFLASCKTESIGFQGFYVHKNLFYRSFPTLACFVPLRENLNIASKKKRGITPLSLSCFNSAQDIKGE